MTPQKTEAPHQRDTFFAPPEQIQGEAITIEGEEFSHLTHVMRKKPGDHIRVADGCGTAYDARITAVAGRVARCAVEGVHPLHNEPELQLAVGVALLKHPAAMDFLVEKLTELGVHTIVPLLTERTIPRSARVERWEKIALAAMKQSGRCILPAITEATPFAEFVEGSSHEWRCIPHERLTTPLLRDACPPGVRSATLCVGPEGGFTDEEIRRARAHAFVPASLGVRRFRTETAAIVAAAWILR